MTAYRYVRTGRLPAYRAGARWMVEEHDLAELGPTGRRPRGQGRTAARQQLEDRLLAADERGAWAVIEAALAGGMDPDDVHLELTAPALRSIGARWAAGQASIADEHRATAVAMRLVGRLGPRFARRGVKRGALVIGAPSGERHALPGAILADVLRHDGYEVVDLGADTPPDSFVDTAGATDRLVAVLIGVTGSGQDRGVAATVTALRRSGIGPVLVRGAAVTDEARAARLGADGWSGPDGRHAIAAVRRVTPGPAGPVSAARNRPGQDRSR